MVCRSWFLLFGLSGVFLLFFSVTCLCGVYMPASASKAERMESFYAVLIMWRVHLQQSTQCGARAWVGVRACECGCACLFSA